jgi:hypothetical protein
MSNTARIVQLRQRSGAASVRTGRGTGLEEAWDSAEEVRVLQRVARASHGPVRCSLRLLLHLCARVLGAGSWRACFLRHACALGLCDCWVLWCVAPGPPRAPAVSRRAALRLHAVSIAIVERFGGARGVRARRRV